ncbi:superoxide dismutase [Candidatus Pacearchaeota archaeon]|nr:superoxide dismutase [Candidatus Pacearchaeota archaeon]
MIFELPKLKYEYGALEPWIDAKTMEIHYTKHHQAYLDKLNKAVEGTELDNKEINEILSDIENIPGNIRNAVVNNGGGYANHSLFWQIMSPNGGALPNNSLIKAINAKWKSFNNFKQDFSNASLGLFGSGWIWLVIDESKELEIVSTKNQDSPISDGKIPILCLDVWEHAYYLKYQNKRADYISAWWNVVNWKKVEELFENVLN